MHIVVVESPAKAKTIEKFLRVLHEFTWNVCTVDGDEVGKIHCVTAIPHQGERSHGPASVLLALPRLSTPVHHFGILPMYGDTKICFLDRHRTSLICAFDVQREGIA